MTDLRITTALPGVGPAAASQPAGQSGRVEGKDFKSVLMESLDQVNKLRQEADVGVEKLMSGESDGIAEVLSASRKAEVAFDLLMEIRNKLLDAYTEIRQIRV